MLFLLLNFIITSLPLFLNQYFPCINFTVTENGVNSNIFSVSRKKSCRIYGQLFWRYLQFSPFLSDSLIPCDLGIDVGIVGKSWFVSSVQEHKLAGLFAVNSFGYILNLLTQRCEVCLCCCCKIFSVCIIILAVCQFYSQIFHLGLKISCITDSDPCLIVSWDRWLDSAECLAHQFKSPFCYKGIAKWGFRWMPCPPV